MISSSLIALIVPSGTASAAPAGAPLIEYTRFPGGNWGSVNNSGAWGLPPALTNAVPFTDPLTGYQNEYASSTNNHLIEYTRIASGRWVMADLTAVANGPTVTNDPAPFVDPITGLQTVYVTTTSGHLAVFTRQLLGGWSAIDLTQSFSGPTVTANPAPFVDPLTGLQNVYVTTPNGHLAQYTRMATRWISLDLTATFTGPSIFNDPAPFTDPLTGFQNVYATTSSGTLVEYTRFPAGNWGTVDITDFYGGPNIVDHPVPFTDPTTGLQNAYVTTNTNHLAEYERQPAGNWRIIDITASYTGALVPGDPKPFTDPLTGFLNVYVTGINS